MCIGLISVDISNVWGRIALTDLLAIENELAAAHGKLAGGDAEGGQDQSGLMLPIRETEEIRNAARKIREESDACVIVGTGNCCLGARAAMELLQGSRRNIGRGKGDPQLFFTGNTFSTRHWNELMRLLNGKDFSVIAVSGAESSLESAIAFRSLRWMMERKYGTEAARKRVWAVTDPEQGALGQMAREEGWQTFPMSGDDRFPVLSAGGLLIMAAAGLDIDRLLKGAEEALEEYALRSFENPVWLYGAVRNLLQRGGMAVELPESFEPGFRALGLWWQQLFGSTGSSGLIPAAVILPEDLYGLEQRILEGSGNLFETMVRFAPEETGVTIGGDWKDLDGLNALEGKKLDYVQEYACQETVTAHTDAGVPVILMECGELQEDTMGELLCFLELCAGICACLQGADPFSRKAPEAYRKNMLRLLGKNCCE